MSSRACFDFVGSPHRVVGDTGTGTSTGRRRARAKDGHKMVVAGEKLLL